MKIVSVCACTSGIAHTYIAKEKLIRAAEAWDTQSKWKHREQSEQRMN